MVINSSIDKEFRVKGLPPLIRATNIGCWRWIGQSKMQCLLNGGPAKTEYVANKLVFEALSTEGDYDTATGLFVLLSGNLEATASGTNTGGGHTYEYKGTLKVDPLPGGKGMRSSSLLLMPLKEALGPKERGTACQVFQTRAAV